MTIGYHKHTMKNLVSAHELVWVFRRACLVYIMSVNGSKSIKEGIARRQTGNSKYHQLIRTYCRVSFFGGLFYGFLVETLTYYRARYYQLQIWRSHNVCIGVTGSMMSGFVYFPIMLQNFFVKLISSFDNKCTQLIFYELL